METIQLVDQVLNYQDRQLNTLVPSKTNVFTKSIEIEVVNNVLRIDLKAVDGTDLTSRYPDLLNLLNVIKTNFIANYDEGHELFQLLREEQKHSFVEVEKGKFDTRQIKDAAINLNDINSFVDGSASIENIALFRNSTLKADSDNSKIFDSINHTTELSAPFTLIENLYSGAAKEPKIIEDLVRKIILTLYQEPYIIRNFFSFKLNSIAPISLKEIYTTDNVFDEKGIFKAAKIRVADYRDGATAAKNVKYVNDLYDSKLNPGKNIKVELPSQKSEGLYAYLDESISSEAFSNNDYTLGYIPFVLANEVFESLTKRKVKIVWKNSLSQKITYFEHGWVFPQAMNVTRESNLFDNKLLFHWIGDSLGVESPIGKKEPARESDPSENDELQRDKIIQNFIKEHIYTKTITIDEDIQIPLKQGAKYSFSLVPINIAGGIPLVEDVSESLEELRKHLISKKSELFSNEKTFMVLDPINPPELVPEILSSVSPDKNTNHQIIIKHPKDGRIKNLQQKFVLLPPRVEFNVARWLGTFEITGNSTLGEALGWIERLQLNKNVPKEWTALSKIDYVFDNRVLESTVELNIEYKKSFSVPMGNLKKMQDLKSVKFVINSLLPKNTEKLDYDTTGKRFVLDLSYGKGVKLFLKYRSLNSQNNPACCVKIINAVPSYQDEDGKVEMKQTKDLPFIMRTEQNSTIYLMLTNVNADVAGYFYIFRRYLRVNPSEHSKLPTKNFLLRARKNNTNLININNETDECLFISSQAEKNEESLPEIINDNSFSSDEKEIFAEHNVYDLSEVFGQPRVEILRELDQKINISNDYKNPFKKESFIGESYPVTLNFKDDVRAKQIDYINAKIYSKHIQYYKDDSEDKNSLSELDYNVNKSFKQIILHAASSDKENILANIPPPKFDLKVLFLNDSETENQSRSIRRKSVLMISFEKNELNVLSDDDYIGIDFSTLVQTIGSVKLNSLKTDLGVDFTVNANRDKGISPSEVKLAMILEKQTIGYKLSNNFTTGANLGNVIVIDSIVYIKPMYLHNENKGFILWDVSSLFTSAVMDPFLKVSICRAYPLDINLKKFARSVTSEPSFIQLFSSKMLKITVNKDNITIKTNQIPQKKKRSHYVFSFCKTKNPFEEPLVLAQLGPENIINKQSYISLQSPSNFNIVSEVGGQFIINLFEKKVVAFDSGMEISKETISNMQPFKLANCYFQLFEFYSYDNIGSTSDNIEAINKKIETLINQPDFNPFNNSNFKMIFKSVVNVK